MGRLGMGEPQRPRPTVEETGAEGPGLREAMSDNHTQKSNAGRNEAFLGRKAIDGRTRSTPLIDTCPAERGTMPDGRLVSNTSRFNEVGKESNCDRGDPKTDGDEELAIHRTVNGRSGERDSEGVEYEIEHFSCSTFFFTSGAAPRLLRGVLLKFFRCCFESRPVRRARRS
jgi:hypothetical protein